MVGKLIQWATESPLVVLLLAVGLMVVGGYSFFNVNIEAYPDPAPAIIEVVAQFPGASAEEVERQVTIPVEVALAGMPGLKYTRTKTMFGLAHFRNQFEYGIDYLAARQEVINRLRDAELPDKVTPQISPASPIGEILRYTLTSPKDATGHDIYTDNDLKSLNDWTLIREFRRVPRIAGVVSSGLQVKRYEIQPDPDRLKEYGITLDQLQAAISNSNANVGGNYIVRGSSIEIVRGIGLIGGGEDPMTLAMAAATPQEAAGILRDEENRRIQEIRQIVITATNNVPTRVEHVVDGGPLARGQAIGARGVIVGHQTRQGQLGIRMPKLDDQKKEIFKADGEREYIDDPDMIQSVILLRKNEHSIPALEDVLQKIEELNESPGRMLPGVKIEAFYNRARLIDVTTETVHENLILGMVLVTIILLMFLSNVRSALIVAVNIPLALMFAFAVLYLRGKSANLLSIGAVDFGIIVDSSVIMVENIYRHISSGEHAGLSLRERILRSCREVERSLFFTTAIMVCAFLPLFTMKGPEGQIFGPMADTYAFALGGALILALTVAPVLCLLSFKNLRPARDNLLVRTLKQRYLWQLDVCLRYRWVTMGVMVGLMVFTLALLPFLGREFMPELEEGNMIVRGTFPVNVSLEEAASVSAKVRELLWKFPEVMLVTSPIGRPDDGTDPTGYYNVECFVPMHAPDDWPIPPGWTRRRTKAELIHAMDLELNRNLIGVNWDFSQMIRDNVLEALSGVKGENSVKIIGPNLDELETLAEQFNSTMSRIPGIKDPGIFHIKGQSNVALQVDRAKCAMWSVSVADVEDVVQSAVGGMPFTQMIEGERIFDVSLRWPERLRSDQESILNIPVDTKNNITGAVAATSQTPFTGASTGLAVTGTSLAMPAVTGSMYNPASAGLNRVPRRRLIDLVTPLNSRGQPDPHGQFLRPGASTIAREQGNRLIAVKFGVRGRDLASTVAEAQAKTAPLLENKRGYRTMWSGEFQQMQEAEARLMMIIPLSLGLIMVMLYLAFRSLLDAVLVFSNVAALSMGGVWALLLTRTNFSISAAVGFISIFGVAIMDGLLMISYFNQLRYQGLTLHDAIMQGAEKRVRPVMMTALTAIFGLLPAAVSHKIGAQTQRPLAIVVVGGMISTLFLTRYLMPVLYSFYGHRPPSEESGRMAH
jgi:cobalt-zinc-cadmium resistance protein CzcA